MTRRHWNRLQPHSREEAIRLCLDYAREKHNRSVARVADLIGVSEWVIYKWMSEGSMPLVRVRPFEHACGIDYVTRYMAHSAHKLLIDIPTGRNATHTELNELSLALTETVAVLMKYHDGAVDAPAAVAAVTAVMEDLAYQRGNVERALAPEFDFERGAE